MNGPGSGPEEQSEDDQLGRGDDAQLGEVRTPKGVVLPETGAFQDRFGADRAGNPVGDQGDES